MNWNPYQLDVVVHGKTVRVYHHRGEVFIEGRKGTEYVLRLSNNTTDRVLAVLSVDGLSVMTGEPASIRDGHGYVLQPQSRITVPGWRLNNQEVAAFRFGSMPNAYAALRDRARNIGVIGGAIFKERSGMTTAIARGLSPNGEAMAAIDSWPTPSRSGGAPLRTGWHDKSLVRHRRKEPALVQNLGTEFGKRQGHRVHEVTFEPAPSPACLFTIRYDDRTGLESRGITMRPRVEVAQPFPKDSELGCVPPPGWDGDH